MNGKRKVGIMGGTFNPIHTGHLVLAQTAYEDFNLDQVLIMPTKNPYYKNIASMVSDKDRLSMIELAIEDNPAFALSLIEFERDGATYTVDTLECMHCENPQEEYYFIMGADSLYHFETWKNPERILELCTILVATRDNVSSSAIESQIAYMEDKYDYSSIFYLNSPNFEISSHDIRNRLSSGRNVRYFLSEKVDHYIKKHQLYRGE